ncbi:MAG: helix-turn-helix domain-containing protein [Gammaproteobacteria bacterium]
MSKTPAAYTIDDATQVLGLSRPTLYREIAAGRLRTYHVGRRRYVSADAVREYIAAREAESHILKAS